MASAYSSRSAHRFSYREGQRELPVVRRPFLEERETIMEKRRSVSDLIQAEPTRQIGQRRAGRHRLGVEVAREVR